MNLKQSLVAVAIASALAVTGAERARRRTA